MVDLFMYRDPEAKKAVAEEEVAPEAEEAEAEPEDAAVANTMKNFEGQDDEEGEEEEETWELRATPPLSTPSE